MRFVKAQRHGPFVDTSRKRAALRRKQRLEREALPLFADQVAAQQPSEDDVMAARAVRWDRWQDDYRAQRAALWRRARQRLAAYGENTRRILRHLWNTAPYPGTPGYLLDMLHSFDVGRLDPENPPWIWRGGEMNMEAVRLTIERIKARNATKGMAA